MDLLPAIVWVSAIELGVATVIVATLLLATATQARQARLLIGPIDQARRALAMHLAGVEGRDEAVDRLAALPVGACFQLLQRASEGVALNQTLSIKSLAVDSGLYATAEKWSQSRWPWLRIRGARVLAAVDPSTDAIERAATDPSTSVAGIALELTRGQKGSGLIRTALNQLAEPSGGRWLGAQETLRQAAPIDELIAFIESHDGRPAARALAVAAAIADPRLLAASMRLVADPDPGTRRAVASVASTIGGELAASLLSKMAKDEDPSVRVAAVEALGGLGLKNHAPELGERLFDSSNSVRVATVRALLNIGVPGLRALRSAATMPGPAAELAAEAIRWTSLTEQSE